MYDVIHISMENWDTVWRRNQNVAAGLARRYPDRKILYVGLEVDLSHALRKGRFAAFREGRRVAPPRRSREFPNVYLFNPVKWFPNTLTAGRLANEAITRAQVRKAARFIGLVNPVLYVNPYYAAHMPGRMGESAVVYDVGDDWTAFKQSPALDRRTAWQDAALTRRADAVIVVSERLREMKQALARKLTVIPNGVDAERYDPVARRALPPHPITSGWARPILGHTGTLQPQRTDVDLVIAVARAFPHGTLALVGPADLDPDSERRLRAEPNVRLTGPVNHADVPRVMSAFDVCIVPHRVNAFSASQSPLKLYEYLAAGLPIVSTPVSGFRDYPELVHLAEGADRFAAAVRTALGEPPELADRRRAAAAAHTWDARIDAYVEVFRELQIPHPCQTDASHAGYPDHDARPVQTAAR